MSIRIQNSLNLGGLLPGHVTREALQDGAEHIKDAAVQEAPLLVDVQRANRKERPGTLRDSAYTRILDDTTAEVGFRDFIAPRMHEDMSLHHDVGHAKFLEGPLRAEKDETLQIIAARLREGLH